MIKDFNFKTCTKDQLMKQILQMYKTKNLNNVNIGLENRHADNPTFLYNVKREKAFFKFDKDINFNGYVGFWDGEEEWEYITLTGIIDKLWEYIERVYQN